MINIWIFVLLVLGFVFVGIYLMLRGKQKCCASCGYPIRDAWTFCPKCGANMTAAEHVAVSSNRDKREILQSAAALMMIPVFCYVLIGLILIPTTLNWQVGGEMTFDKDKSAIVSQELIAWVEDCDKKEDAFSCYILRQDVPLPEADVAETRCSYVIYVNDRQGLAYTDHKSWADKWTVELTSSDSGQPGYLIFGRTDYYGDLTHQVKIDGEKQEIEVTQVSTGKMDLAAILEAESE